MRGNMKEVEPFVTVGRWVLLVMGTLPLITWAITDLGKRISSVLSKIAKSIREGSEHA
jgi:hypothetical protein